MALPTRVSRASGYIEPFEAAQRDFDSMLSRFFGGREWEPGTMSPYGVDVREDADHLYVDAELPGFKKEDVNVTLENQTLNITAERREDRKEGEQKKGDWLLRERRYNRYQRSFSLPNNVNDQKVDAKLQDGVLTITLDKREESKPRKIQVG
jgi:HSP20 family molecular chaperone IbpA